jgi:glutathione peroxidase
MLRVLTLLTATALVSCFLCAASAEEKDQEKEKETPKALDFTVKSLDGKEVDLKDYEGKVILIVNVASQCGLTPQYKELEALHEKYSEKGLAILGFPCNQFGGQEPGTADEIREFCTTKYDVKFDLFSKIDVNDENADPLYKYLTSVETEPKGPGKISWNFEKFLLDREGNVIARFEPRTKPSDEKVVEIIEKALEKKE